SFSDFAISAISGSQKNITEIIEKNILVVIDELRNSTPIVHKKARCNRLRPRMMGHKLINKFTNGNVGSLGGIVKGKCGNLHILTAYHVVKNNNEIMYSDVGQPIISPPDSRDYRKDTIGRLSWYSESLDIAFIEVDPNHQHRITGGSICCDIVDDNLGVVTSTGGTVKICSSWQKGTIKGKIKSTYCAKRLTKGNSQVLKNLVQTENMAVPGDSGSLVIDDSTDKVVGMMVSDNSTECSYFTKLDILKSRIYKKIKVRNTEHIFDFTFKKFVN
ncbi:MAG: serine protease, partial [Bacteroidota bacterium]